MLERFDYETYGAILDVLLKGHRNLTFRDCDPSGSPERGFILRHDVDYDPAAALRMAEWEAARGIRATYFLLFHSDWYNLLSPECCEVPRRLVQLGHDVGLHYDTRVFGQRSAEDVREMARLHARLLGGLSGEPVRAIARHNDGAETADPLAGWEEYLDAYAPAFTQTALYLSDSAGAWRDEAVRVFEHKVVPSRVQLLIHPIFWDRSHAGRRIRLADLVARRASALQERGRAVDELWPRHPGVHQHERRSSSAGPSPGSPGAG